jgi:hypothetical protein
MAGQSGSIQVIGLTRTLKELKDFGDKGTLDAIKKANLEAANQLVKAALPLVPRQSGALVGTVKAVNSVRYAAVRAGSPKVPYAGPIHWGWAVVGATHKGKLTPSSPRRFRNIKPQPFFAKAYGYTKEEIMNNYEKLMNDALKKYNLK